MTLDAEIHPTTALHMAAIERAALIEFLTDKLELKKKEIDFLAGCLKRAAEEQVKSSMTDGVPDPGAVQASAIVGEEARQLMLSRVG